MTGQRTKKIYGYAIELASEAGRQDLWVHAYWRRGECYEALGDRALLDYEDAHKIDPEDDVYLSSLAELRAAQDREKRLAANTKGEA
jgi:tetratricopeptide (TPR) repeat protein